MKGRKRGMRERREEREEKREKGREEKIPSVVKERTSQFRKLAVSKA